MTTKSNNIITERLIIVLKAVENGSKVKAIVLIRTEKTILGYIFVFFCGLLVWPESLIVERDNGNVHRAAANIIVSKSRAARGSVCNVLLSDGFYPH